VTLPKNRLWEGDEYLFHQGSTGLEEGTHSKQENTTEISLEKQREVSVATRERLKRGLRPGMASVMRSRSIAAPPRRFKAKYAR